ncbi:restriction endonuclease subunit S [Arenibacter palladensis]|uniref:restriction endonuclease subunit S n=1 Tax=Arenibacter palladensis TaxID=237373 RepID=UPI002FD615A8
MAAQSTDNSVITRTKDGAISTKKNSKHVPKLRFKEFEGEWKETTLGNLFTFKNGLNSDKEKYGSGIKFINVLDIIGNEVITYDSIIGKVEITQKELDKNEVIFGDVLFQRSSETREEVGQANIYVDKDKSAVFGGFVIRGRKRQDYNPFYINYLLKTSSARKEITTKSGGSTRYNVGQESLSQVFVKLSSLPEQQKIASFLSAVDQKIQQLTKKKKLLEEYKKGVMQQLFSKKIRFTPSLEDFKDVLAEGMVIDLAANYPDWNWVGGNKLFDNISDKNHNSDLPILAITQDQGAIPRDMIDYQMTVTEKSIASYKVVQVGDFVISLRTFQGGIEYSNYHGICSPAYIILRPNTDDVDRTFYKFYLKTSYYIKQLQKNLEGIRDGKMISYKYFSEIKLPFPSLSEQQKIANYLSAVDTKIEGVNKQIEKTQMFKKGLLQQMFV